MRNFVGLITTGTKDRTTDKGSNTTGVNKLIGNRDIEPVKCNVNSVYGSGKSSIIKVTVNAVKTNSSVKYNVNSVYGKGSNSYTNVNCNR